MRKNIPLHETLAVFHEAGLTPDVRHGRGHIKVRAKKRGRSLLAVVGTTPSDQRAGINARAVARRLVKEPRNEPQGHFSNAYQCPDNALDQRSKARLLVEQRNAELSQQREERRRQAAAEYEARIAEERARQAETKIAKERARVEAQNHTQIVAVSHDFGRIRGKAAS